MMKQVQFLNLIARANAERAILDAGSARGDVTVRAVRDIHAGITRGLEGLDDAYSLAAGALRRGGAGLDSLANLVNDLQKNNRVGPQGRGAIAENCSKIISEFSRVGVFNSFNIEVGLVLAQRYAKSNNHSIRFSEIEPDDLRSAVDAARTGRAAGLTRLISNCITHSTVHRAEAGGYQVDAGARTVVRVPDDIEHRLGSISMRLEEKRPERGVGLG